jgi:hypothetical protein
MTTAAALDPFADAKPRLSRRGREAWFRVNPEQAPAFRPGSRGVDSDVQRRIYFVMGEGSEFCFGEKEDP